MRKIILLLLVCAASGYCSKNNETPRQEIIQTFADGKPKILNQYSQVQGQETLVEQITFNNDGKIFLIENPLSKTKTKFLWHANGRKKSEVHFKAGKKHGPWNIWYSQGGIKSRSYYHQDQLLRRSTYTRTITAEEFYLHGDLSIYREYKNGRLATETFFHTGKIARKIYFYPNGQKSDEREYQNGILHGKCTFWQPNGLKRSEITFQNGIPLGKNE